MFKAGFLPVLWLTIFRDQRSASRTWTQVYKWTLRVRYFLRDLLKKAGNLNATAPARKVATAPNLHMDAASAAPRLLPDPDVTWGTRAAARPCTLSEI